MPYGFKLMNPDPGKSLDDKTLLSLERTGLAYERTLMGWVRTCVSLIGFAFTIWSFFLSLHGDKGVEEIIRQPRIMCLALTIGGTLFMVLAVIQHYLAMERLFKSGMGKGFSLAMFAATLVCGAGLVATLAILAGS